jgi:hypothetical protein
MASLVTAFFQDGKNSYVLLHKDLAFSDAEYGTGTK